MNDEDVIEEDDDDAYYPPKTVKEAVNRYIELWDNGDFELISECPKNKLDFLWANIDREVRERCSVNSSNTALLEACGSEDMKPEDAS